MKLFKIAAVALGTALVLTACSPANQEDSTQNSATDVAMSTQNSTATSEVTEGTGADALLSMSDAVVRASVAGNDMTSIFGTLSNNSEDEISVTGFSASVEASHYEIHEVVDGVMQEKAGGFVVPAGGSVELAPGGDHFMIMGLSEPVQAGDEVALILTLSDGTEVELDPIPARTIAAGDEDYGSHGAEMNHEGH